MGKAQNKHDVQCNPTIAWHYQQTNIDPFKSCDMQPHHLAYLRPIIYAPIWITVAMEQEETLDGHSSAGNLANYNIRIYNSYK